MKNSLPTPNLIPVSERLRLYTEDPRLRIQRKIKKSFLIIIFSLIIAGALIFYLILRLNQEASTLQDKQNQLVNTINSKNLNTNLTQDYETIAPFSEKIKAALPLSDNLLAYQNALEQLAQGAGVQISVNFASSQATTQNQPGVTGAVNNALKTVEHTVELKGNLTNFAIFVKNLENLPYFVQVSSFNLASQTGLNQDSTATITLKVYTQ